MANTTFEERRLLRVDRAERAEAIAQGHRANALKWERKGKAEKAEKAIEAAEHNEHIARRHRAEAERLETRSKANRYRLQDGDKAKAALDARAAAQKLERVTVDPLAAYIEAMQHAQRHDAEIKNLTAKRAGLLRVGGADKAEAIAGKIEKRLIWADQWRKEALALIASSGRDLKAEWAADLARLAEANAMEGDERRGRVEMKLPLDMRTAGAQREFVAGSERHRKIASLTEYANLIPRPHARTNARLDAMARFDRLCSWAEEGLFPTVSMEAKGKGSPGGSYQNGCAEAGREMDALRNAIGGQNVEMLRLRIYQRQTLTQLARDGFGTEKTAGVLTLAAIDAMAVHFAGAPGGNVILAGRASVETSTGLAP